MSSFEQGGCLSYSQSVKQTHPGMYIVREELCVTSELQTHKLHRLTKFMGCWQSLNHVDIFRSKRVLRQTVAHFIFKAWTADWKHSKNVALKMTYLCSHYTSALFPTLVNLYYITCLLVTSCPMVHMYECAVHLKKDFPYSNFVIGIIFRGLKR